MNTGQYRCLEIFAKAKQQGGSVKLFCGKQMYMEQEARTTYYTWLKFPVEPHTKYTLDTETCEITLCYLSGSEHMLETGITYLEQDKTTGDFLPVAAFVQYDTPIREAYHFAPWKNWMNDPNGLCWFQGYYHMFYQFNPHGQEWSNMYWGHAASRDLVHWTHLPVVLEPQKEILEHPEVLKGGAFSGSAVAGKDEVIFYLTRHTGPQEDCEETIQQQWSMRSKDMLHFTEEQCLITSYPEGSSFDFRDPKVLEIQGTWYMVLGSTMQGHAAILLYESKDMENWTYLHPLLVEKTPDIRCFECPDFMELDGKYLAIGAWMEHYDACGRFQMSRYYIGEWKDKKLQTEHSGWFDFGGNCYAMQSFEHEGRRISIGWVSDFYGEHVYAEQGAYGSMTLPREMHIKDQKLFMTPVKEVETLVGETLYQGSQEAVSMEKIPGNAYRAKLQFQEKTDFSLLLGKDGEKELWLVQDEKGVRMETKGVKSQNVSFQADVEYVQNLEIYLDHRTAEVYLNDGEAVGTRLFYSSQKTGVFVMYTEHPEHISHAEVSLMKNIWEQ